MERVDQLQEWMPCVTGGPSPSEPRFVTAAGRCLLNEVGLEEERDGLTAEEAVCCLGELGSLAVSKQSCTHGSVLFGYSVSRLSVIPAGRGFSLSPCNFNGCRRIRQNFVQFPMNWSEFSPRGNAVLEGQPCTQQRKESTVKCAWLQNLLKIKAVVQTELRFPPKVKIPLGLNSLQQSLIIHFVWENLRLLLATEYLKCSEHRTYWPLGKGYAIGRYLDKLSNLTLLGRTDFYSLFFRLTWGQKDWSSFQSLSDRCSGVGDLELLLFLFESLALCYFRWLLLSGFRSTSIPPVLFVSQNE